MPNISISKQEMIFLKAGIIKKYCETINENPAEFTTDLTGTLRHYEMMADKITEYLDDVKKLYTYCGMLKESPFKIMLKKLIDDSTPQLKKRNLPDSPVVTGNMLRKLLFYGPDENELSFKDFFILACYAYIDTDRSIVVKKLGNAAAPLKTTLLPEAYKKQHTAGTGNTITPFSKPTKCTLVQLDKQFREIKRTEHKLNNGTIILNRANTDPSNYTITSKIQAKLDFTGGEWHIENFSELKTTSLLVIRPLKLQKGDIIVMGDQFFQLEE